MEYDWFVLPIGVDQLSSAAVTDKSACTQFLNEIKSTPFQEGVVATLGIWRLPRGLGTLLTSGGVEQDGMWRLVAERGDL